MLQRDKGEKEERKQEREVMAKKKMNTMNNKQQRAQYIKQKIFKDDKDRHQYTTFPAGADRPQSLS